MRLQGPTHFKRAKAAHAVGMNGFAIEAWERIGRGGDPFVSDCKERSLVRARNFGLFTVDQERFGIASDLILIDHHLGHALLTGQLKHHIQKRMFQHGT
jgi:hypothetical protein